MVKARGKPNILVTILLYLMIIGLGLFFASLITLFALIIADFFLYPKQPKGTYAPSRSYLIERVNWTFAAIVFVVSFIAVEFSIFRKDTRREKRDENLLTELNLDASKVGDNPKAFMDDDDSFATEFSVDRTRFEGRFYVQVLPRKGGNERIGVAVVKFKVNDCGEEYFYIGQKEKFAESNLELLSITPLSNNNATQKLDGKYDYSYLNYKFFNDFLADDEIIEDLSSNYNNYGEKTVITFSNREFSIECRKEVSSDEDFAQEDSSELLKNMYVRAQKYYRRFQVQGVL